MSGGHCHYGPDDLARDNARARIECAKLERQRPQRIARYHEINKAQADGAPCELCGILEGRGANGSSHQSNCRWWGFSYAAHSEGDQ